MNTVTFKSKLLPDGHLYCPKEYTNKKNARFKVIVSFENDTYKASDKDIELSSIKDISSEFLSREEINYYLNLEEL